MAAAWSDAVSSKLGGEGFRYHVPIVMAPAPFKLTQHEREGLFERTVPVRQSAQWAQSAKAHLGSEPLAATALWGWSAAQREDRKAAGLRLAEQVTRRELGVQMEWFRAKATDGNLAASLKHLDRALTVFPEAGPVMLAGLAQALDVADVRSLMVPYRQRPWFATLIRAATTTAPEGLGVAALLTETRLKGATLPAGTLPAVLQRLVQEGEGYEAGQLALRTEVLKPVGLEQFGIGEDTLEPEARPLSWQLSNTDAVTSTVRGPGKVDFAIAAGRSGTMLERVTVYQSGNYKLTQALGAADPRILLIWELRCLDGGGERSVWSQTMPVKNEAQRLAMQLSIPEGCPAQRWRLRGAAIDLQVDGLVEIDLLDLELVKNSAS